VVMYMREPSAEMKAAGPVPFPVSVNIVLLVTAAGTIYFGLYPNHALGFLLQKTLIGGLR